MSARHPRLWGVWRQYFAAILPTSLLLLGLPVAAQEGLPDLPAPPPITALGAVLFDPSAERVLWGLREGEGRPMASTTKIMTTLLALEAGTLDDTVEVSRNAAQMGGAGLGLKAGQRIPMRSVLAGLMLRSGNDAATAVAEHVAGSEEAFVQRMNERAAELGLQDTAFVNASGLTEDPRHRASPLDLARLAKVAMAHPDFAAWSAARRLAVPGLGSLENRNELLGRYPGADGVKTGYLLHAGMSLVASATRDGLPLYAVVLGSRDNFGDAEALLDWGHRHYRLARPAAPGAVVSQYRWADATVPVVASSGLAAAVRRDADVVWTVRFTPAVARPVGAGAVLGEARLLEAGAVVATAALHTPVDADPPQGDHRAAERAGHAVQESLRALLRLTPLQGAA